MQALVIMPSSPRVDEREVRTVQLLPRELNALWSRATRFSTVSVSDADMAGEELLAQVASALGQEPVEPAASTPPVFSSPRRAAIYEAAVSHIEANLADAGLTPSAVARAVHVSTRYLCAIFQEAGTTVGALIRSRRLAIGRDLLLAPESVHTSIAEVARKVGYHDPSRFAGAFRDAYGLTPREFRKRARRPALVGP